MKKKNPIYFGFENWIFFTIPAYRSLLLKDIIYLLIKKYPGPYQALISQTVFYRDKGSLRVFSALWLAVITVYAVWSLLLRHVHVHLVIYSHYAFIYRRTVNNWNVSSSEILILVGQNCFDFDRLRTKWEKCFQNSSINYISWYYMLKMKISYIRVGEYFVYRGITHMQL